MTRRARISKDCPSSRSLRCNADDPRPIEEQPLGFDVIRDARAKLRRRRSECRARAAAGCTSDRLRIPPRRSILADRPSERTRASLRAEKLCALDAARRVECVAVDIGGERIVEQHAGAEEPFAALCRGRRSGSRTAAATPGAERCAADGALKARGTHASYIGVLHVADPAVHDLKAMRGGARGKIVAFDERGAVAAQRSLARGRSPAGATADDEEVEALIGEAPQDRDEGLPGWPSGPTHRGPGADSRWFGAHSRAARGPRGAQRHLCATQSDW